MCFTVVTRFRESVGPVGRQIVFVEDSFRRVPETNRNRTIMSIVFAVPARLLNAAAPAVAAVKRRTEQTSRAPPPSLDGDRANSPRRQPNRPWILSADDSSYPGRSISIAIYNVTGQLRSRTDAHTCPVRMRFAGARHWVIVRSTQWARAVPAIVIFPPPFLHSCPRPSGQKPEGPGPTCRSCPATTVFGVFGGRNGDDLRVNFRVSFSHVLRARRFEDSTSAIRLRRTRANACDALKNLVIREYRICRILSDE